MLQTSITNQSACCSARKEHHKTEGTIMLSMGPREPISATFKADIVVHFHNDKFKCVEQLDINEIKYEDLVFKTSEQIDTALEQVRLDRAELEEDIAKSFCEGKGWKATPQSNPIKDVLDELFNGGIKEEGITLDELFRKMFGGN